MSNELIKIDENCKITARELYEFLELAKGQFARWATQQILHNQFAEEGVDYEGFDIVVEGNLTKDYKLSIEFAKKLCMISKSERGEQARNYFIEVEKKLKQHVMLLPKTYGEALRELAATWEREQQAIAQLETAKPKVEFFDAVADSKTAIPMADAAKVLDMGIGRNNLFKFLRDRKVLMYNNRPYQEYIDRGYFRTIEQKWNNANGDTEISIKTLVYQKGLEFIRRLLQKQSA